jgi:hypothetical protein
MCLLAGLEVIEDQRLDFVALSERCGGITDSLNGAFQIFACYAEMLYPILDLVITCDSDLAAIRDNSLREAASHELLHRCPFSSQLSMTHDSRRSRIFSAACE